MSSPLTCDYEHSREKRILRLDIASFVVAGSNAAFCVYCWQTLDACTYQQTYLGIILSFLALALALPTQRILADIAILLSTLTVFSFLVAEFMRTLLAMPVAS